jgi:hypothetical protein
MTRRPPGDRGKAWRAANARAFRRAWAALEARERRAALRQLRTPGDELRRRRGGRARKPTGLGEQGAGHPLAPVPRKKILGDQAT